ncbi:glycoside hydrolase/deacetylase [Rhizoclosmatium globosum]|uniref:Glycoside hydrolase/deacetylase n=1 Tax=Rhizoclosmatium globosum TaxID=329046 RepID=A0A1Y2D213_9FUNG|nr:glycoside hydrolase/deacetylase [Rhizoclosmatium globosum]|eukprot:ORY53174.1 glycoside hydrolase/deacetylase [Rhizoclosmatium globosum]
MIVATLIAFLAFANAQDPPNYPSCTLPPVVPKWTAFVKSLEDPTYPWVNTAPSPTTNDGGATGGAPNANGAAWGTLDNKATEVYACPANQWALSFDDGPVLTDQSMAILKQNNVVGTFFLIGSTIVQNATHKQFVADLYNAGHQIALHSWTHRQMSLQTTDEVISELIFNILAIYNIIGKVPRYYRPAYSAIDDRIRNILYSMGLRPQAPAGIDISGQNVTVENSISHVKNSFNQKYDPRWNYFPSKNTVTGGRFSYDGFISLEHDITAADIQIAQSVVPFAIMPGASFYLDDNAVLTQFIKGIKLPLTAADLAAFTGTFPANPAGGAKTASGDGSSSAGSPRLAGAGTLGVVSILISAIAALFL